MEKYFSFNKKALASFGLHMEKSDSKFAVFIHVISICIVLLTTFQSLMYLISSTSFEFEEAKALTIGMYDLQGCFKIISVSLNLRNLGNIKKKLNELVNGMTKEQCLQHNEAFNRYRLITSAIATTNFIGIWIFNIIPAVILVYFYFVKGIVVKTFPLSIWYPFDKLDNYFIAYVYDIFGAHILTVLPHVLDGFILLLIGQLVILFRCLGDNFVSAINEFKQSERKQSDKKMKSLIQSHGELLDLCEEFFHIYEIPLLANVLTQTGTICFVAFIVTVRLNN